MSIYNCTISELQHFVITIANIETINLHVLKLKIEHYSKRWILADPVTYMYVYILFYIELAHNYKKFNNFGLEQDTCMGMGLAPLRSAH